jgi:hypothetical protein
MLPISVRLSLIRLYLLILADIYSPHVVTLVQWKDRFGRFSPVSTAVSGGTAFYSRSRVSGRFTGKVVK